MQQVCRLVSSLERSGWAVACEASSGSALSDALADRTAIVG